MLSKKKKKFVKTIIISETNDQFARFATIKEEIFDKANIECFILINY